jgi:hypothetical protein
MKIDQTFFLKKSVTDPDTGCWLWTKYRQSAGYGQICVQGKRWLAHRLAFLTCKGEIPDGLYVCHSCDIRACVNPDHLFLGTAKDNVHDMMAKGRKKNSFCKGHILSRNNRKRKLSDDDVRGIRASNWKLAHLSDKFGVSIPTISLIRNGKRKILVK